MTNDDNMGLASADEETRERVAREGGKASHKNDQINIYSKFIFFKLSKIIIYNILLIYNG